MIAWSLTPCDVLLYVQAREAAAQATLVLGVMPSGSVSATPLFPINPAGCATAHSDLHLYPHLLCEERSLHHGRCRPDLPQPLLEGRPALGEV